MFDFLWEGGSLFATLGIISLIMFLATLIGLPIALAYLPDDFFAREREFRAYRAWDWVRLFIKNIVGWLLIVVGIFMLIAPGQGVLTIVVGILLIDFPGKRRLQRWLVERPKVESTVNWLRQRAGRKPLKLKSGTEEGDKTSPN